MPDSRGSISPAAAREDSHSHGGKWAVTLNLKLVDRISSER